MALFKQQFFENLLSPPVAHSDRLQPQRAASGPGRGVMPYGLTVLRYRLVKSTLRWLCLAAVIRLLFNPS